MPLIMLRFYRAALPALANCRTPITCLPLHISTLYAPETMQTQRTLTAKFLGAALVLTSALGWSQPSSPTQDNSAKQDLKSAGHETKDAAKDTGHAVKKTTVKAAHATENGTKKVAHATATDTKEAAHATAHGTKKVWEKTKSTTKGAVNGAKEGAEQPAK